MKRAIYLAALFFVLQGTSQSQSDIRIELNGGLSFVSESNTVLRYRDNGLKIGGSVSYIISPNIHLLANLGYSRFGYSGQGPNLATPAVIGFRREMTGEASKIYEASLGTRLIISHNLFQPFISVRSGIQSTQVGEIRITEWMEQSPQTTLTTYVYQSSGTSFSKPFASIGFGVAAPVYSSVYFLLEGTFTQTFDGAQLYYPVFAALQFQL